jgi:azurin
MKNILVSFTCLAIFTTSTTPFIKFWTIVKEPISFSAIENKGTENRLPQQTGKTAIITLSVVKDLMQYSKKLITVKAGQKVIIELENPDGMQHNMVISKPGTMQKVGAAADALARDPKGAEKHYVPAIPEVLYSTKLINSEESASLKFTAPAQSGDYPFMCTFPGHWRGMNGIMRVVK